MHNSLEILSESLDKKVDVLNRILKYNEEQERIFREGHPDMDSFDAAVEEKDALIEEVLSLDQGFESLYEKISEELQGNRQKYAAEIKTLQDKIRRVTELSTSVQAGEARNKKLIEEYFMSERLKLGQERRGTKAAYDYYKSMNGVGYNAARFMDQKN